MSNEFKPSTAPLDPSLYALDATELEFFKSQTGIYDEGALKEHILDIQAKAYKVFSYPCIRFFNFTKVKISRLPVYDEVLRIGREREGAILLDMACCFGNDARKAVADGYPVQNVIGSDLRSDFWEIGTQLFGAGAEKYPIAFTAGDAFDPTFLARHAPFYEAPTNQAPLLSSLTSLTPLLGHVSALHASSFFHLFDEEKQLELARILASLLSPVPGSVIFGLHGGKAEKGFVVDETKVALEAPMFCHSPDSWRDLWDGVVFEKGTVKVDAILKEFSVTLQPGQPKANAPSAEELLRNTRAATTYESRMKTLETSEWMLQELGKALDSPDWPDNDRRPQYYTYARLWSTRL